jgi:predicted O-methyltransferase YrrM
MVMSDYLRNIPSSYQQHNLGKVLYNLVLKYKPETIIEFGVFCGYSTICLAEALVELGEGQLFGYDLWELYPFRHTSIAIAQANIDYYNLGDYVSLQQADFFEWLDNPGWFDMLHVDISNDGDIVEYMLTKLEPQINNGAIVVFEGGSVERDQHSWMVDYGKRPINPLQEKFGFEILDERFPSISLMRKT